LRKLVLLGVFVLMGCSGSHKEADEATIQESLGIVATATFTCCRYDDRTACREVQEARLDRLGSEAHGVCFEDGQCLLGCP